MFLCLYMLTATETFTEVRGVILQYCANFTAPSSSAQPKLTN